MTNSRIQVAILRYPGVMTSAAQGLAEQFFLANRLLKRAGAESVFHCEFVEWDALDSGSDTAALNVVILPPGFDERFYLSQQPKIADWLLAQHAEGAILCSVCAGAFLLAQTGLLDGRSSTTHWMLTDELAQRYPATEVDAARLLINDGDIITSGGLMSWMDLGLELVAQFTSSTLMRELGRYLLIDTGERQQRFYASFTARLDHGDEAVLRVQHELQRRFAEPLRISSLADLANLTERTFLRRFTTATGHKPTQYIQRLRIQKACDLFETTRVSVERVAMQVGYDDVSAFRKTFQKITGQTPREFRQRFVR